LPIEVRAIANIKIGREVSSNLWKYSKRLAVVLPSDEDDLVAHRQIQAAKPLYVATANGANHVSVGLRKDNGKGRRSGANTSDYLACNRHTIMALEGDARQLLS
jgi:hypothetical protein